MQYPIRSTSIIRPLILSILIIALFLASACKPANTPQSTANTAAIGLAAVIIELTDKSITAPTELPTGIVSVTVKNQTPTGNEAQCGAVVFLVRLADGKRAADFKAVMEQGMTAGPDVATGLGGICVKSGGSGQAMYNLTAGAYLAVGSADGPPQIAEFTVKPGNNAATAPSADVKAQLVDFSFVIPDEIKAGPRLWEISNKGTQWHNMSIIRLNEGATIDKVIEMVATQAPPSGPPPAKELTIWDGMSPGATAWAMIDLPPGEYYVLCFMPDMTANPPMPHASKGMVRMLKVTE